MRLLFICLDDLLHESHFFGLLLTLLALLLTIRLRIHVISVESPATTTGHKELTLLLGENCFEVEHS